MAMSFMNTGMLEMYPKFELFVNNILHFVHGIAFCAWVKK